MRSQRLPIFPLSMVLFPGTAAPLHLFEPRYRQMLIDVRKGDSRFGIVCGMSGVAERALPSGRVGCVAEVTDVEMLPDGRSQIIVVGRERFMLDQFVDDEAPYHCATVSPVLDVADAPPVALAVAADEVASNFKRVVRAVNTLNDDESEPPELPDNPSQLAWTIGAMIDLELETRQALLSERSPSARLATIDKVLRKAVPELELKAAMHRP